MFLKGNLTQPRWRLVNGSTPADGRLEYQSNDGNWVCVCYNHNQDLTNYLNDLCKELGFKRMMSYYEFTSTFLYGRCSGQIYHIVHKYGRFSTIPPVFNCSHSNTISLHCSNSK